MRWGPFAGAAAIFMNTEYGDFIWRSPFSDAYFRKPKRGGADANVVHVVQEESYFLWACRINGATPRRLELLMWLDQPMR